MEIQGVEELRSTEITTIADTNRNWNSSNPCRWPFNIETMTRALNSTSESVGFSLRLGKNTNFTYMLNRYQDLPEFEERGGGVLAYEWPRAQYDFNYPLEVSSSIFRAAQILPLLASISYSNPNTLESGMAERSRWFTRKFPKLLCFETSVTFCNPVNKVQTVEVGNRAGLAHSYTVEDLALYFDKGERIDVKTYSGFCPNA